MLTQPGPIRVRADAVIDFIALDWVDHETGTFFEDVHQLPPGHAMIVGENGLKWWAWWTLDPSAHATGTMDEWAEEYARLFTDAVKLRLRADVEVGSCLSGGIDSSSVVCTAAQLLDHPMHAFTCAYDEGAAYDERAYVRAVIEKSAPSRTSSSPTAATSGRCSTASPRCRTSPPRARASTRSGR